jgi:hypothetical protein
VISRKLQAVIVVLGLAILAMGFYIVHLKRKAETVAALGLGPVEALAPPPSGPTQQMTIYVASDEDGLLRPLTLASALPTDAGGRGRLALHTLIARYLQPDSPHPLGSGAEVREVYLLDPVSAVVDLSPEFANGHRSGVEVEQLSVFSLVLSLRAQMPELRRVRFLVEGKSRETLAGHFDLSGWLDVATVADAARQQIASEQP